MGSGTVQEASEWVEYVTSSNESPMTNLRKKNGRAESWKVKYWGIGNETWGCGGNMTPEYAADLHKQIATFMRGPIFKIASGANVEDYHWTETFMQKVSPGLMQGLSLHYYTVCHDWGNKGSATQFDESEWFLTLQKTLKMQELVQKHSTIMDQYDPRKRVGLMVDEWGNWHNVEPGTNPGFLYQQNTLRDAMVAGTNLNIFNNRADRVKMANIAQMINVLQSVILTKDGKMILTPTYYVFKLFNVHQDALLIPIQLNTASYTFEGKSIPAVNASASVKNDVISITLCNLDPNKEQKISFRIDGKPVSSATGKVITAKNINDYNDFGVPEKVNIGDLSVPKPVNGKMDLTLPPKSVVLVQFK
jgi:alpha-N-arabinofuranosidase